MHRSPRENLLQRGAARGRHCHEDSRIHCAGVQSLLHRARDTDGRRRRLPPPASPPRCLHCSRCYFRRSACQDEADARTEENHHGHDGNDDAAPPAQSASSLRRRRRARSRDHPEGNGSLSFDSRGPGNRSVAGCPWAAERVAPGVPLDPVLPVEAPDVAPVAGRPGRVPPAGSRVCSLQAAPSRAASPVTDAGRGTIPVPGSRDRLLPLGHCDRSVRDRSLRRHGCSHTLKAPSLASAPGSVANRHRRVAASLSDLARRTDRSY